jgi:GxxExxY protein
MLDSLKTRRRDDATEPRVVVSQDVENLTTKVLDGAFSVHRTLGPGLFESVYHECLAIEMVDRGLAVELEKVVPIQYRGRNISAAFRLDMMINGILPVELKAVESIQPIHRVQVATYLRLLKSPLGLLLNFNVPLMKHGVHRVLNLEFRP